MSSRSNGCCCLFGVAAWLLVLSGTHVTAGDPPVLVRLLVRGDRSVTTEAGVLIADEPDALRVLDLRTGQERSFKKSTIRSLTNPATEQDVAAVTGIAPLVAWFIAEALPSRPKAGQIASVSGAVAYINRGSAVGVQEGERFDVFRGDGETILDPETGEDLGSTQRRIAQVEVIELREKLSKVRLTGEFEVELTVGDVVRPVVAEQAVAVLPLGRDSGQLIQGGVQLAEQITSGLAKNGVTVVERTLLDKMLEEQSLAGTGRFDPDTIQRVGKLLQAQAIVTGTIQVNGKDANVNVRLIDVESGKVLYATSLTARGISIAPVRTNVRAQGQPAPATVIPEASSSFQIPEGATDVTNTLGMTFVLIPAGDFMMGSPANDPKASADEFPQHPVRISKPFFLGQFEVTRGQFAEFVRRSGYQTEAERKGSGWGWSEEHQNFGVEIPKLSWRDPGWRPYDDNHPVVDVTWADAVAFCEWLSQHESQQYRLPTEAEWEYAYRAGSDGLYPQGEGLEDIVNYGNVADKGSKNVIEQDQAPGRDGYVFTAPVGQYPPNSWGLYDMAGNVWEWCSDWYDPRYFDRSPAVDPRGPAFGPSQPEFGACRVARNSSWYGHPWDARAGNRDWHPHSSPHGAVGFRVVLVP